MATYLFDFDGTLVDSMPTFSEAFLRLMDQYGLPYDRDTVKTITPLGYAGTAKYLISRGMPLSEEEILCGVKKFAYDAYCHTIPLKPNVRETLERLHARGDDLHILTASPHAVLDPCLARHGIDALFTNVWSCEDFGTTKADPAIYQMAAERMGAAVEQVIFVDDNIEADRTAKAAGMTVYGIFDETSRDYAEDIRAVVDRYILDFSEILEE